MFLHVPIQDDSIFMPVYISCYPSTDTCAPHINFTTKHVVLLVFSNFEYDENFKEFFLKF